MRFLLKINDFDEKFCTERSIDDWVFNFGGIFGIWKEDYCDFLVFENSMSFIIKLPWNGKILSSKVSYS